VKLLPVPIFIVHINNRTESTAILGRVAAFI
jgi:hypothetical protein